MARSSACSCSSVRRIVITERIRKSRHADELDMLLGDLFRGRFPYVFVEHKLIGVRVGPRGRYGYEDAGLVFPDG
jgi:hypothetical protein